MKLKILFTILVTLLSLSSTACDFEFVQFQNNFESARLNRCEQNSDERYTLTIRPENTPINDSPWYAFKVSSDEERKIKITIKYEGGNHRYPPKVSHDLKTWQSIPFKVRKEKLSFHLNTSKEPIWVAAQEIIPNDFYSRWLQQVAHHFSATVYQLGESELNRPILALEKRGESNEWLVVLGRMHPPEITGALALFPFMQNVLDPRSPHSKKFLSYYNVLLVPNLNPDGVAAGNWRHNANGIDLNRDWGKFRQKETKLIHDKLQSIINDGGKISFAIDFHSTNKDIFYTMPSDYDVENPLLVENWLSRLDKALPDFKVEVKPGNNPNRGVFKQYIADTYKVHAITYEMGDNTNRALIQKVATKAAELLKKTLLEQTPVK